MLSTAGPAESSPSHLRRLATLVGALFLLESSLFSAVTPLVPHYARELALSQADVGLLAGAYSIGMLAGTPFAVWSVTRAGVRATNLRGLTIFAVATLAFAIGHNILALDAARTVQGFAGGCLLTAGFSWLIGATSDHRRERMIGGAMGAAVFGTLVGPLIGTLAVTTGVEPVFGVVVAGTVWLIAWVARMPDRSPSRDLGSLRSLLPPRRPLPVALWTVALPGIVYGALGAVMPLHLTHLGARGVGVGATFLCAAGLATLLAPLSGRFGSRRGLLTTLRTALLVVASLLLALVLASGLITSVALAAVLISSLTTLWVPSVAMLARVVEAAGLDDLVSAVLISVLIAAGEGLGAILGSRVADSVSDGVTFAALGALVLMTCLRLTGATAVSLRLISASALSSAQSPTEVRGSGGSVEPGR